MMVQKQVRVTTAAACAAWVLGAVAAVMALAEPARGLDGVVTFLVATAATLNIRGFVGALEARERNAFELGRDAERSVRQLR